MFATSLILASEVANSKVVNKEKKVKYLNDVVSHATRSDFKDISKLMGQMPTMVPSHKEPTTGVQIFKVTRVSKGSLFEKAGYRIGDLVVNGKSPKNNQPIQNKPNTNKKKLDELSNLLDEARAIEIKNPNGTTTYTLKSPANQPENSIYKELRLSGDITETINTPK
jgi:hypothetical protein